MKCGGFVSKPYHHFKYFNQYGKAYFRQSCTRTIERIIHNIEQNVLLQNA